MTVNAADNVFRNVNDSSIGLATKYANRTILAADFHVSVNLRKFDTIM